MNTDNLKAGATSVGKKAGVLGFFVALWLAVSIFPATVFNAATVGPVYGEIVHSEMLDACSPEFTREPCKFRIIRTKDEEYQNVDFGGWVLRVFKSNSEAVQNASEQLEDTGTEVMFWKYGIRWPYFDMYANVTGEPEPTEVGTYNMWNWTTIAVKAVIGLIFLGFVMWLCKWGGVSRLFGFTLLAAQVAAFSFLFAAQLPILVYGLIFTGIVTGLYWGIAFWRARKNNNDSTTTAA